ncbi:MAG: hypothetical protein IT280_11625 [Ignavibacteria bacterium]|nr:hypothetical protein [Ignavibacteria bacterium]
MKNNSRKKFSKTSMQSMIRIAQINGYSIKEILPKILNRESENIKKIKKKKYYYKNTIKQKYQ